MKNQNSGATPHCYILDENFRVKLARPGTAGDPLNRFYTTDSAIDALPAPIETVVRDLTAHWGDTHVDECVSAIIDEICVSVTPLHGPQGRHLGVFIEQTS